MVGQIQVSFSQTTIKMEKVGGVFMVPCTVNGLNLKFIFDTGASDVSISLAEAIFMLKNDYLKEYEIIGTSYSQIANGDITENTKIILREIEFAGLKIYNVEASVIHEIKAPLLLGQSAMAKLGKFQFDPNTGVLTIFNNTNNSVNYSANNTNRESEEKPKPTVTLEKTESKAKVDGFYVSSSPKAQPFNSRNF
jgi:clan AA aspartic protease (TIGR02281 family)